MSKKTQTSFQAKHALARVAFFARVLLHSSMLFVVALFPCATPGMGLVNVTESEAPADQDESSAKEAISLQCRTRVVRNQPSSSFVVPMRSGLGLAAAKIAGHLHTGHRLSNNLLAPLRC
ncbi:MAG: hypothetical protein O3C40_11985 [Planctomycetota bacterium]|nr:hypothetical protein [Planctomycetota bacterium]